MSLLGNRFTAVVAGAAVIATVGATGAVAADMITSADIQDNTIHTSDIQDGSVGYRDFGVGPMMDVKVNKAGVTELQGQVEGLESTGLAAVETASLEAPTPIAKIGGPINTNNTDLNTGLTLPAGKYLITVDGAFMSAVASSTADVDIYPQLSLWLDKSGDGAFQWQADEGDISPNALMPDAANRHISTSGRTIVTLDAETHVGLLGFGYASDTSSKRSGEINVVSAMLTATPLG